MLSRSSRGVFRRWAARAIAALLIVYLLGAFGIPTFVPYLAVLIVVLIDGARSVLVAKSPPPPVPFERKDTIH